jgi:hypothetical protein
MYPRIKYPFKWYCKMNLNKYPTHRFACSEKAGKWLFGNHLYEYPFELCSFYCIFARSINPN